MVYGEMSEVKLFVMFPRVFEVDRGEAFTSVQRLMLYPRETDTLSERTRPAKVRSLQTDACPHVNDLTGNVYPTHVNEIQEAATGCHVCAQSLTLIRENKPLEGVRVNA